MTHSLNSAEHTDQKRDISRRTVAFFAWVVALLLAALGEYTIRTSLMSLAGVAFYAIAILLVAGTSVRFHLPHAVDDTPSLARTGWVVLATGMAGTFGLGMHTFLLLHKNTGNDGAFWWWIASLLPLLLATALCWRLERPHVLWRGETPDTRAGKWWFALAVVLIFLAATCARFLWLDAIPWGINPDEGDRAAVSIQIVRETTPAGIFEVGWYYISMIYFHLMALAFKWFGIGYVQARAFTAVFGAGAVAIGMWIGWRHFSWRTALLVGIFGATTGVVLQFSRLTTEAGPTATQWLLSLALFLEGARTGRSLPWALAGFAGGFSLYFYPTGRVWALLAILWGVYLLVRWMAGRRGETIGLLRGLAIAAVASLVIAVPYLTWINAHPHELTLRYEQTNVFDPVNAARLDYVNPEWSQVRLIAEQLMRTLGIFNYFPEGGGVWPIHQPILTPALAVLVLVGVGMASLRWRDPRHALLAIAFWVGISGVVITVETPNLIRMATAIPLLPLFAALALEEGIVRTRAYFVTQAARTRAHWLAATMAVVLALGIGAAEARFYFVAYARMNLWEGSNQEGRAMQLLAPGARYVSLGSSFHMVNSGWVRLIAPEADRAGFKHPGSNLPFINQNVPEIGVLVYPGQEYYVPWLQTMYPDATQVPYWREDEGQYFTLLQIPATALATQGKIQLTTPAGDAHLVDVFGAPAAEEDASSMAWGSGESGAPYTWSATWRLPQQWNYSIRLTGANATLLLDGAPLLVNTEAIPEQSITLNLARGDHGLRLTGTPGAVSLAVVRLAPDEENTYAPIPAEQLLASDGQPRGLAATVQFADRAKQFRQDNTLATCCIADLLQSRHRMAIVTWQGTLAIPEAGEYGFRLRSPGAATLTLGDADVLRLDEQGTAATLVRLSPGERAFVLELALSEGANGALELIWQPPGGAWSILPHTQLAPESSLLHQDPLPDDALRALNTFPVDQPSETLR